MSTRESEFQPFPLFTGCHIQTIVALFSFYRDLPSITRFVHLPDGEKISMEIATPPLWENTHSTVVMVHGLCGSHKSPYLVRLTKKLTREGVRVIRINLRGCGSGKGHAKRMYHAEASDDIWNALKEVKRDVPESPLIVLGFSLGGNIILKMGGERGEEALTLIDQIIAINPPLDMYSSVSLLSQNRLYERFFMHALKSDVEYRQELFEDMPPIEIPRGLSLLEFDELYIAPQAGFSSAKEYYQACSSGRLIPAIRVPSHLLFSKDDPIVDCKVLDYVPIPPNVDVLMTKYGGHLGYLGIPGKKGGFHWMDSLLFQWIFENRD